MELSNEFEVPVPIEQAWAILTDLERIAPCLPGAQLQEVEGEHYRGIVKIKVGPITAQYKGQAVMVVKDDATYRAELEATGRDTRGAGNASAAIVAQLTDRGASTHVSVLTDLSVTGKVAQFGRGVLADVSAKLLDQFVANLEATVLADDLVDEAVALEELALATDDPDEAAAATEVAEVALEVAAEVEATVDHHAVGSPSDPTSGPEPAAEPSIRRIDAPVAEPVDLLDTAGSPVLKRALPLLGLIAAVLVLVGLRRRRRSR
jgi:carbon monoxide dehydrogenase subunit G